MRISDWSSGVLFRSVPPCDDSPVSTDTTRSMRADREPFTSKVMVLSSCGASATARCSLSSKRSAPSPNALTASPANGPTENRRDRKSVVRDRECQYVEISVVAGYLKKKKKSKKN